MSVFLTSNLFAFIVDCKYFCWLENTMIVGKCLSHVNNKDTTTTSFDVLLVSLLLIMDKHFTIRVNLLMASTKRS